MSLHRDHEGDYNTGNGGYVCIRGLPEVRLTTGGPWPGVVCLYAGYDVDGEVVELSVHVAKEIIVRLQKAVEEAERVHP